jgi:hypothetical protein
MMITITFCPDCATTIYKEADAKAFENIVFLQSGTLDVGLNSLAPQAELWVQHRPKWLPELTGATQSREFE